MHVCGGAGAKKVHLSTDVRFEGRGSDARENRQRVVPHGREVQSMCHCRAALLSVSYVILLGGKKDTRDHETGCLTPLSAMGDCPITGSFAWTRCFTLPSTARRPHSSMGHTVKLPSRVGGDKKAFRLLWQLAGWIDLTGTRFEVTQPRCMCLSRHRRPSVGCCSSCLS